jgi:tetratricopeptide (TPR) repeat protein
MAWVERTTVDWDHWELGASIGEPLPESRCSRFQEDEDAFAIRFLEDVLARVGEDRDVLEHLGHLYTRAGRYRDGLAVDRKLVSLKPRDPLAHYNLACSWSLLEKPSRAVAALKKAIDLGYRDVEHMEQDPDLENLRSDPRWDELVGVLKS